MMEGISFQAILKRATTTSDGGWDVTLSVSQNDAEKILQLSVLRDTLLQVGIVHAPVDEEFLDG